MSKTVLVVLLAALAPVRAFAVDGVVLINQSTVMAQGGFPYVISQPGSYKLSGNLVAPLNSTAIVVSASNVTLDLNGFSVQCSSNGSGAFLECVTSFALPFHDIVVRNGSVSASVVGSPSHGYVLSGIIFSAPAQSITLEDLQVRVIADNNDAGFTALAGPYAIIKGNIFTSNRTGLDFNCPSVVVNNVNNTGGIYNLSGSGCTVSANVGIN